jgi:hypothetical protein
MDLQDTKCPTTIRCPRLEGGKNFMYNRFMTGVSDSELCQRGIRPPRANLGALPPISLILVLI